MATRLQVLSSPKKDFLRFPDRRSLYWIEKAPPVKPAPMTPRQTQLAAARPLDPRYLAPRSSPVWRVTDAARHASSSPRVSALARHRPAHPDHVTSRVASSTKPSAAAKKAEATPRIQVLSTAKLRLNTCAIEIPLYPEPITSVGENAKKAACSSRLVHLSAAKDVPSTWIPPRPIARPPTQGAKRGRASSRVQELSIPKPRLDKESEYDPYLVPSGALIAQASNRINELCLPISRKQKTKFAPKK